MLIKDFEIYNSEFNINNPHCIVILKPWINVGNVGQIVIKRLYKDFHGQKIGKLNKPSKFYDYTRFRPTVYLDSKSGERKFKIPNSELSHVNISGQDILLLQLLEPHSFGEDFNDSILEILDYFKIKRYIQIGGMYDSVPHTRQLLVTGSTHNWEPKLTQGISFRRSNYEGPTSIVSQIIERIKKQFTIETMSLMVHLPLYLKLDDDYAGASRLLKVISEIYQIENKFSEFDLGKNQYEQVTPALSDNNELRNMIERFEKEFDSRNKLINIDYDSEVSLLPEVEKFLNDISSNDESEES
ncbi:MAG: PAC2 family protein [Dehalococcoidia bacterium]